MKSFTKILHHIYGIFLTTFFAEMKKWVKYLSPAIEIWIKMSLWKALKNALQAITQPAFFDINLNHSHMMKVIDIPHSLSLVMTAVDVFIVMFLVCNNLFPRNHNIETLWTQISDD